MSNRDEEELFLESEELAAAWKTYEGALEGYFNIGGASSSERSSAMDQIVRYYDNWGDKKKPSVRELTSRFDKGIEEATSTNDLKKLGALSEELSEIERAVKEHGKNIEELKAFVAQYAQHRSRLISEAIAAQVQREEMATQQSQDKDARQDQGSSQDSQGTPVIPSASPPPPPSSFFSAATSSSQPSPAEGSPPQIPFSSSSSSDSRYTIVETGGETHPGAKKMFDALFAAVKKGNSSEERGEAFSKTLNLSPGGQWRVNINPDDADELMVSGTRPFSIQGFASMDPSNPLTLSFECRVSNGEEPGVKFDLDPDPLFQEAKSKQVAEVAAELAKQVGNGAELVIYDNTGRMEEKTLLGIMDTLKTAGVGYRIQQSLKDRFPRNETIQDDGTLSAAASTSPSLGRGPGR